MEEIDIKPVRKKRRELIGVCTLLFFALAVAFFTVNYLTGFIKISLPLSFIDFTPFHVQKPDSVTSYLSGHTKTAILRELTALLEEKRVTVSRIEKKLEALERDREKFLVSMEQQEKVFHENIAIVDDPQLLDGLKSLIQLKKDRQHFDKEMHRRIGVYLSIYDKRSEELEKIKQNILMEITELQQLEGKLKKEKSFQISGENGGVFVSEVKRDLYQRFLFCVEHGVYHRALEQLDLLLGLEWNRADMEQLGIVRGLLSVLTDYQVELKALEDAALLDELKLSFLAEEYDISLSHVNKLEKKGYLSPLLMQLRETLNRNITAEGVVMNEIEVKSRLKDLSKKAEDFEKQEEYGKAVSIYEDLLILNLPSYDREFLIQKLHSLMIPAIKKEIKRRDNTEAIKYLENARKLYREGRNNEAAEVYVELVKNCPNSDYIEEAVSHMLRITEE
jgi:hypothetical protein